MADNSPMTFRLTKPEALTKPAMMYLFQQAYSQSLNPTVFRDAPEQILAMLLNPLICYIVGVEKMQLKGLGCIVLPMDKINPVPQCTLAYNEGSAKLRDLMIRHGVDFVKQNGYNRLWAINASGHENKAWISAFKRAGKVTPIGTIMEFEV